MDDEGGLGILPTEQELAAKKKDKDARPDAAATASAAAGSGEIGLLPPESPGAAPEAAPPAPKKRKSALEERDDYVPPPEVSILTLKTQVGQERRVAEMLSAKAKRFDIPILSLLSPSELRGFVFIETTDVLKVEKGIRGVSYARALVTKDEELMDADGNFVRDRRGKIVTRKVPVNVPFEQIAHFLQPVSAVAKIAEGDIVELVSGPFRGEKAKVTRVDDAREEITVELIDSLVPIPITVKGEHVRVLNKSGE